MRFFFYGTLIADSGNPVAAAAHALLHDLGPAAASGSLYAIADPRGWYPALVSGAGQVQGRLYESAADFGAAQLTLLDSYEDFDPADPLGSLYVREAITVTGAAAGRCDAQAYRFNQPLPAGARPIAGGDFSAWLKREGLIAYGAAS